MLFSSFKRHVKAGRKEGEEEGKRKVGKKEGKVEERKKNAYLRAGFLQLPTPSRRRICFKNDQIWSPNPYVWCEMERANRRKDHYLLAMPQSPCFIDQLSLSALSFMGLID